MSLAAENQMTDVIKLDDKRLLSFKKTLVMGVLNITPDSFSDGGSYDSAPDAVARGLEMEAQGANIIDIGGESTRPGADPVAASVEMDRVLPVIEGIRKQSDIAISIDTCKASVAKEALNAGADIVNDISALRTDPDMVGLVALSGVPVILMHMLGTPATMQQNPQYEDCVGEIGEFFAERVRFCQENGIDSARIILDPGIGFGKRLVDNVEILARAGEFKRSGQPVLIGTSRKSFINMIHKTDSPAKDRIGGSIASMISAVLNGADIVRVHDVAETVEALKVVWAIKESQ